MFKYLEKYSNEVSYEIRFDDLIVEFLKFSKDVKSCWKNVINLRTNKINKDFYSNIVI